MSMMNGRYVRRLCWSTLIYQ